MQKFEMYHALVCANLSPHSVSLKAGTTHFHTRWMHRYVYFPKRINFLVLYSPIFIFITSLRLNCKYCLHCVVTDP